jgi:hypothetical protein
VASRKPTLDPPKPLDYFFIIGFPLIFLSIAVAGIFWLLGPAPHKDAVTRIREGAVQIGATREMAIQAVGPPMEETSNPDGSFTLRYRRGTEEPLVEEDAFLDFTADGFLMRISYEKSRVPIPPPGGD